VINNQRGIEQLEGLLGFIATSPARWMRAKSLPRRCPVMVLACSHSPQASEMAGSPVACRWLARAFEEGVGGGVVGLSGCTG